MQILDGYVDVHPREWLRLRVGKMKAPIGLERLQERRRLRLPGAGADRNLSSQRDVGVQLWGDIAGGIVHYVAGIYNGASDTIGNDTDINHAKHFVGRLFFHPFKDGVAARVRQSPASGSRWALAIARGHSFPHCRLHDPAAVAVPDRRARRPFFQLPGAGHRHNEAR